MARLQAFADNVWIAEVEHAYMGLHVGARLTVIRLSSGALLLHSPIPLTAELRSELDALGPVGHIVCPNLFHHVYAGEAAAVYPRALLHGPRALHKKRRDLAFAGTLGDTPHPDWSEDLRLLTIHGCLLHETVFYHPASRTLIACDLVENFHTVPNWFTRTYLRLGGVLGRAGWHPLLRLAYYDRRRARACVDRLLEWPFERLALSHGEPLTEDARDIVRKGLAWL